jgi:peptidyl-prolyl cis-trans isomerase D
MISLLRRLINSKVGLTISFLALLGFSLIGLGGGGIFSGSFGGGTTTKDDIVTVGKYRVGSAELRGKIESDYENYRQQQPSLTLMQYVAAGGMDQTYDQLVDGLALEQFAAQQKMAVSDAYVQGLLKASPGFQNAAGKFDQRIFDQYLSQTRTTLAQLTRQVTQGALAKQLVIPTVAAQQVPGQLALPYASLLLERRDGQIGLIPANAVHAGPAPTEAELTSFYQRNSTRYIVPERRAVRYAIITPEQVKAEATPTEQEIAAVYNADRARYQPTEKRTIAQVLVVDQATANALAAKVKAGTSLEAAAQGIGLSAATIKDIEKAGYATQGSAALADAVFAAVKGTIVGPVKTPLGYAVARVDAINQVAGKTLDQARPDIVKALTATKTQVAMGKLHDAIDDAISGKASFGDVVARYKLTALSTPALLATGVNPEDTAAKPDPKLVQITQAAFAMDPAEGPQMAPYGQDGSFALVAIDKIVPAAPRPMAQMRDTLVKDFTTDRNMREARKIADAVSAQLTKGVPFAQALAATGLTLKPAQTVSAARVQSIPRPNAPPPPPPLVQMFKMSERTAKVIETPDHAAYLILWVGKITPGDATGQPRVINGQRSDLAAVVGREYVEQFAKAVRASVGVTKNDRNLAALRAALSGQGGSDQP